MTRAYTRGQKLARKRARAITLPGGDQAPQRPMGRDRWHTQQPQPPAELVALKARAKRTGCTVEEARDVLAGEDLGRCIRAMCPNDRDRRNLLNTWQAISASKRNWDQRIIGAQPNPQAAALAMLPEAMQTDQSLTVDLRNAEERDESARRSWMAWLDSLMALPADQRHALRGHIDGYAAVLWDADALRPTRTGALAVAALSALHVARGA